VNSKSVITRTIFSFVFNMMHVVDIYVLWLLVIVCDRNMRYVVLHVYLSGGTLLNLNELNTSRGCSTQAAYLW